MLRGISTISFYATDLAAARAWYSDFLGVEPYYERPGYLEFRLGDHQVELGLIDARYAQHDLTTPAGAVIFWHVDDLAGTFADLIARGARQHEPLTERGEGFVTAVVVDPFGNLLGIMTNPHYLEILNRPTPRVAG